MERQAAYSNLTNTPQLPTPAEVEKALLFPFHVADMEYAAPGKPISTPAFKRRASS